MISNQVIDNFYAATIRIFFELKGKYQIKKEAGSFFSSPTLKSPDLTKHENQILGLILGLIFRPFWRASFLTET